jgi:hypothetical protein
VGGARKQPLASRPQLQSDVDDLQPDLVPCGVVQGQVGSLALNSVVCSKLTSVNLALLLSVAPWNTGSIRRRPEPGAATAFGPTDFSLSYEAGPAADCMCPPW